MNQFAYRPGAWQFVVEAGGIIAVPADFDGARLDRLHRMLAAGQPQLTDVIDVLAAGSIAALGSFAVVLTDSDAVRVAVRGPVEARIRSAAAEETVSGAEVSTWAERYIAGPSGFELTVDDDGGDSWYPIASGVVLAAVVRYGAQEPVLQEPVLQEPGLQEPVLQEPGSQEPVSQGTGAGEVVPAVPADPERTPLAAGGVSDAPAPEPHVPADATAAADDGDDLVEPVPDEQEESAADSEPETEAEAPEQHAPAEDGPGAEAPSTDAPAVEDAVVADHRPDAEPATGLGADAPLLHTLVPVDLTIVPEPEPFADPRGDHDGATISLAEMRRLRAEAGAPPAPAMAGPDAPTAVLPAVDASVRAPSHGLVRLSTGQTVELDRTVIIGRRPRSTRASGETMPHLVAVDSPQQDISRSHLEIRPEGDSVVVIDLRTTNGSTLLRPGADPVRLHPGEHTLVLSADVVDLGDGVTVTFEGIS